MWQSIRTAPKEFGFTCIVKETKYPFRQVKAKRLENGEWANMEAGILLPLSPTHWMPLPEPPK